MNSFKDQLSWIAYLANRHYDVEITIIIENAKAFIKAGGKDFSEYTDEELKNVDIV